MKKIYIAFVKTSYEGAGIDNKLVAWWTNGVYYHTEILIPNTDSKTGYDMWSTGGTANEIRGKEHKFNNSRYDYKEIEVTDKQLETIKQFLLSIQGNRYDALGILGFIIPVQDRSDRWFCSEVCSNSLKIIGYRSLWSIEPSSISPNRLFNLIDTPKLTEAYINILKDKHGNI